MGPNAGSAGPVEPALSVADVHTILEDPAIRTDPHAAPWQGLTVEDEQGSIYYYDGASWTAMTPGGDLWGVPGSTAEISETPTEVRLNSVDEEDIGWVREVLDQTPGLQPVGDHYEIRDHALYRDGFIEAAAEHGIQADRSSDTVSLTRPAATRYVWVEPGDDHVWLIDDTAAVLAVQSGEELVVAGRLVPDTLSGVVWQPAPDTRSLSGAVTQVFSNIDGAVEQGGLRKIPFKVFVPGEAPPIREDKIATNRAAAFTVRAVRPPAGKCSLFDCFLDAAGGAASSFGSEVRQGYSSVANATGEALASVDMGTLKCITVDIACQLQTARSVASGGVDVVTALWKVRGNIFREKACDGGSPGPGRGPNGDASNYAYPVERGAYNLEGLRSASTRDLQDQLELARAWMPPIELSAEEQCGEILRVFAKVHAYGEDGEQANSLSQAERVEIVYTLFFKEDGGRFEIIGADHPGDNEGFVIGLVRTNQRAGLCATGFEFVAGRTVGHKEPKNALERYLQATEREIDDFDTYDLGTGCPGTGDSYRLLAAEAKHATYYHRNVCERALAPNLPVLVGGFIGAGLPGALTADALLKLAPERVQHNLQNGLEECESGRGLIDLSDRVELYFEEPLVGRSSSLGFDDTYLTEDGPKAFAEAARGRWCFGPDASSLPRYPYCDYDYHIPEFFDYLADAPSTQVPSVVDLSEQQARAAVESAGLLLAVTTQLVDHPNADGIVITQSPAAGSQVEPGSTVTVRVGVYTEVSVPDVFGVAPDEARFAIEAQDLVYAYAGTLDLSSDEADYDGLVVDQDPAAGTEVVPGTRVRVYVGSYEGPATVYVPDLIGWSASGARSELQSLGLEYAYGGELGVSDYDLDGVVVDQYPVAGAPLEEGGTVTVYVGIYAPPEVDVPDLGGLTEADARDVVESAGLVFQVAGIMETSSSMVGRVVDQDPMTGTVEPGSTIWVWIGVAESEPEPSFPAQVTSSWVSVSITGGHGSTHSVGDQVELCYSWEETAGESGGMWKLWDFQPPDSSGVLLDQGLMASAGSECMWATITAPTGYEEIVIAAGYYEPASDTWEMWDWANVMMYVTE